MTRPRRAGQFPASSQSAWFAQLPTLFATSAALFTNPAGHVLLVKPNYRDHWLLPGGILEDGEAPHAGCRREVSEETGLDIEPGPLLVVGWAAPEGARPKPIVVFVFDGGVLADDIPITPAGSRAGRVPVRPGRRAGPLPPAGDGGPGRRGAAQPPDRATAYLPSP